MFEKSLEQLANSAPEGSLFFAEQTVEDKSVYPEGYEAIQKGEIFAVIRHRFNGEVTYHGIKVEKGMEIFDADYQYLPTTLYTIDHKPKGFKFSKNPTKFTNARLEEVLVWAIDQFSQYVARAAQKVRDENKQRAIQTEMVEDQIKALKKRARARRKEEFFDSLRGTINDETRKVIGQLTLEQQDETVAIVKAIALKVAEEEASAQFILMRDMVAEQIHIIKADQNNHALRLQGQANLYADLQKQVNSLKKALKAATTKKPTKSKAKPAKSKAKPVAKKKAK